MHTVVSSSLIHTADSFKINDNLNMHDLRSSYLRESVVRIGDYQLSIQRMHHLFLKKSTILLTLRSEDNIRDPLSFSRL